MENSPSPGSEPFPDRMRWLTVVGVVEILIGGSCGLCGVLLLLLAPFFRQNPSTAYIAHGGMLTMNVLAFFAAAVLFVWLGIGTMRARRWARDLMLVAAWVWLIVGALAVVLVFVTLPGRLQEMSGLGGESLGSSEIVAVTAILAALTGFLYVVLPGLFVLFYSNRGVRRTVETRDASARWTGKCPLSVLTLCQFLACSAIMSVAAPFYTSAVPVGRRIMTGVTAKLILVSFTVLNGYLAWAIYKLRPHAWWINFCFTILAFAWFFGSFTESGLAELASGIGLRVGGRILGADVLAGKVLSEFVAAFGACYVVFLLLIKKHFKGREQKSGQGGK